MGGNQTKLVSLSDLSSTPFALSVHSNMTPVASLIRIILRNAITNTVSLRVHVGRGQDEARRYLIVQYGTRRSVLRALCRMYNPLKGWRKHRGSAMSANWDFELVEQGGLHSNACMTVLIYKL